MGFRDAVSRASADLAGVSRYLTPPDPTIPVPRWEYAVITVKGKGSLEAVREQLDAMGTHGWELVTRHDQGFGPLHRHDDEVTLFFKRPCVRG
jgi:hypothetical protein